MKILRNILIWLILFSSVNLLYAVTHLPNGLAVGTIEATDGADTVIGAGDLYIDSDLEVEKNSRFDGTVSVTSGLIVKCDIFTGISQVDNSTQAFKYISSISSVNLTGNGTSFCDMYVTNELYESTQCARNITISFSSSIFHVPSDIYKGSCTIIGYDQHGELVTETIHISTAYYTDGSYIYGTGLIAWLDITTVTIKSTSFQTAWASINMGFGSKLGLTGDIQSSSDVIKIVEGTTSIKRYNASAEINLAYDTYDPVTKPTSILNYYIWFKQRGR